MTSLLEDIDASIAEVNNALKDSTTHLPIIACGSALHYLKHTRQKVVDMANSLDDLGFHVGLDITGKRVFVLAYSDVEEMIGKVKPKE